MGLYQRFREWMRPAEVQQPQTKVYVPPELFSQIHSLKNQVEWLGKLVEDEERNFTYGEDGTIQFGMSQNQGAAEMFSYGWAYSQCLYRPGYGACFAINETQHRIIRARSRAFTSINPYWHGVQHNIKTHVVGTGHRWTVVRRHPDTDVAKSVIAKAQKALDLFYESGYRQVQEEKCDRASRDGEYFLQYIEEDKSLRVRFVEPLLVWTPPTLSEAAGVWFGIRFNRGDYEKPLGYYVRRTDMLGSDREGADASWLRPIRPDMIQHRKKNVDKATPRGIPDTYWVQSRLEQSLRTLRAMGTLVQVRAKIAMIRKRVDVMVGAVQPMLSANAAATISGPGSTTRNVFQYPDGTIMDTSGDADYQFPSQNIETDKIVASVQADLQAVATSMGLADYMVSGSLGNGSYATAMVAEGPVVKTFEQMQQDMIDSDREVAKRILEIDASAGRLPENINELVKVEMNGPQLTGRNEIAHAQANQIKLGCGVLSVNTWQQEDGLDPETEKANNKDNPPPMTALAGGAGGGGRAAAGGGSGEPRNRQASNARPFSPDQEPRQMQRASGATREEAIRVQEGAYDPHSKDAPAMAEIEMAGVFITPDWLAKTKAEINALPSGNGAPREWGGHDEYAPGIRGVRLGTVDGQDVWAVDASAVMVANNAMDFIVAGNHERFPWIPADKILVDWCYPPVEAAHDILHEVVETRLMSVAKWGFAMAHKLSNFYEKAYLFQLRPELRGLGETSSE